MMWNSTYQFLTLVASNLPIGTLSGRCGLINTRSSSQIPLGTHLPWCTHHWSQDSTWAFIGWSMTHPWSQCQLLTCWADWCKAICWASSLPTQQALAMHSFSAELAPAERCSTSIHEAPKNDQRKTFQQDLWPLFITRIYFNQFVLCIPAKI